MEHEVHYQRQAHPEWTRAIVAHPGCERLLSCTQCGLCAGTCPLAAYIDVTPRRLVQLVRGGFRDEALRAQTIWYCAACYSCTVHCPQGIEITEVMRALKRQAADAGLDPPHVPIAALAHRLHRMVQRDGRTASFWVMLRLLLRANPARAGALARAGVGLLRSGRLAPHHPVEDMDQLRRVLPGSKEA